MDRLTVTIASSEIKIGDEKVDTFAHTKSVTCTVLNLDPGDHFHGKVDDEQEPEECTIY